VAVVNLKKNQSAWVLFCTKQNRCQDFYPKNHMQKKKKKKLLTLNTSAFHCGAGDKIEGLAQ
jgi:hypothetical protein